MGVHIQNDNTRAMNMRRQERNQKDLKAGILSGPSDYG